MLRKILSHKKESYISTSELVDENSKFHKELIALIDDKVVSGTAGNIFDIMIRHKTPVVCIKKSNNTTKVIPAHTLGKDLAKGENKKYLFRVTNEEINKLIDNLKMLKIKKANKKVESVKSSSLDGADSYGPDYKKIKKMNISQRADLLEKNHEDLKTLIGLGNKTSDETADKMAETTSNTILANKTTLEEVKSDSSPIARGKMKDIKKHTEEIMKTICEYLKTATGARKIFSSIEKKSNGSIIEHVLNVLYIGIPFLLYYNEQVKTGFIQRMKIRKFDDFFRRYYAKILGHMKEKDIIPEVAYEKGMRSLTEKEIIQISIGMVLHDIGKIYNIGYFEGEGDRDPEKLREHVYVGADSLMTKGGYSEIAILITGEHHGYNNHPDGYGVYLDLYNLVLKEKGKNKFKFCISYDPESVMDLKAVAFFPAAFLAIVDVFVSLAREKRGYRKKSLYSDAKAKEIMEKEFVNNEKRSKLDPILLSMFWEFMKGKEMIPKSSNLIASLSQG